MKHKLLLTIFLILYWFAPLNGQDSLKVEWLGWVEYSGEYRGVDPGFYAGNPPPTNYYRKDIEIGLREDGVVVWRKTGSGK